LIENGDVVGETQRMLERLGRLIDGRLPYRIPFPVAMDRLRKRQAGVSQDLIATFINDRIPGFDRQPETYQQKIRQQVQHYFESLTYHAETFELFDLKGTPSHILVDKQGLLRECAFGDYPDLETRVQDLLRE
jgi:hypothetical protein